MKKLIIMITALSLMLGMAQCRKTSVVESTADDTVSMTITAGPGRTDISTTGGIVWKTGDRIYVSDGTYYRGYLTLQSGAGSPTGVFTGTLTGVADGEKTFHFFYLGSVDYTGTLVAGTSTSVAIDFSSQNITASAGVLQNANKYHIGHGTATGTVSGGTVSKIKVTLTSKVAIAYFEFKDGDAGYQGALTLSGTNIYNSMTVGFGGTFVGGTVGGIGLGGGSAQRYVMLVPTGDGAQELKFKSGNIEGKADFAHGIEANRFYRMPDGAAIAVDMVSALPPGTLPGVFTVGPGPDGEVGTSDDVKVHFSKGNLYYDNDAADDKKWNFESNQYDFRTYSGKGSCIGGTYNSSAGTPSGDWGLFGWSTGSTTYGMSTSISYKDYSGDFVDWGGNTIYAGGTATTGWRTLTQAEWSYLIGESSPGRSTSLRAWSAVTFGSSGPTVSGLILMPDNCLEYMESNPLVEATDYATWQTLESKGAVFLPAAGLRYGTGVDGVGSDGCYWSSTPNGTSNAYRMYFYSGDVRTVLNNRYFGNAVRLVRSGS